MVVRTCRRPPRAPPAVVFDPSVSAARLPEMMQDVLHSSSTRAVCPAARLSFADGADERGLVLGRFHESVDGCSGPG